MLHKRPNLKSFLLFLFKSTYIIVVIAVLVGATILFLFWNVERTSNNLIDSSTNQFRVTGDAKRLVKPDTANIVLSAVVKGKEVRTVQSNASDTINKAIVEIKKLGVTDDEIKTSSYNITPQYEYLSGTQNLTGYTANISLTVKTKLLDKVGNIVDVATGNGINVVSSLDFYIENSDKIKDELKLQAIENAKAKAVSLASSSGLQLGKLKNVEDGTINYPYIYNNSMLNSSDSLGKAAGTTPNPINLTIQPGESEISSSVVLVYQIN